MTAKEISLDGHIQKVATGPDGSLYILYAAAGSSQIFRIDTSGRFYFITGDPNGIAYQDGIFAVKAASSAQDLDVGPDGAIYLLEPDRIRKIYPTGKIGTIAGGSGATIVNPDGSPATSTQIHNGRTIKVTRDGQIYYLETGYGSTNIVRVCAIDPAGRTTILGGSKASGDYSGNGGPALRAGLGTDTTALAACNDGTVFVSDRTPDPLRACRPTVFMLKSPLPVFSTTDIVVPSQDGQLLYKFDQQGVHQETWSAVSGEKLLTFQYDTYGRLVHLVDAFGRVTTIERTPYQDPVVDPLRPKCFTVKGGDPSRIIAPNGQATEITLDDNGYLYQAVKPGGATFTMTYAGTLLVSVTGPRDDRYAFEYNNLGLLTKASDPLGGGTRLSMLDRDQSTGKGVRSVTAMGLRTSTTLTQDAVKNTVRTWTDSDGAVTTLVRRPDATQTLTAPDGTVTDVEQSPDPRTFMTAPYASRVCVSTAGLSSLTSQTRSVTMPDPNKPFAYSQTDRINVDGRVSATTMGAADAAGERVVSASSPMGIVSTARIDRYGRPLQANPAGGFYSKYFSYYDTPDQAKGLPHESWQGAGADERRVSMTYNTLGLPATTTDPLGRTLALEYDGANRLTTQTLPDGRKIVTGYDASGNVTSLAPPGRPAYRFEYNLRNESTASTLPAVGQDPGVTTFHFDLDRRLDYVSRPSGKGVRTHYDAAGRADLIVTSGTVYRSTFYPVTGKLAAFGDGATTLTNTYKGSLLYSVGVEGPYGVRLTSGYGTGFRVTATHLFDGQSTTSLGLAYDNDDRVTGVGAERLAYDPASGILTGTAVGDGVSTITSAILERSGFGEVKHVAATRSGAALYGADFAYDKLGRITSMTQTLGGSATVRRFTYDLGGRLRAVRDGATTVSTYAYDANGNRLSRADGQGIELATYDNRDRLLTYVFAYGTAVYGYDTDGRLATRTVGAAQTVYGYDDLGNLKRVDLPDGRRVEYVLSPAGERLGRKVNGAWTHRFVYGAGLAPVAELDGAERLKTRFVYATSPSVPDYLITYGGGTQTGLYRVIRDQVGSVRLVVNVATGATAQRLDYDEFGRVLADSNPGFQPFGFAGGLWDADTGLVHFGAREYDPQTGRFTAPDPAGFGGGLNLYGYVMNDPVNLVDPAGLGPDAARTIYDIFTDSSVFDAFCSGAEDGYIGWSNGFIHIMSLGIAGNYSDSGNFGQSFGSWMGSATAIAEDILIIYGTLGPQFFYNNQSFKTISQNYWKANGAANGASLHHWLIPQRWGWVPQGIRNAGFNLLKLPGQSVYKNLSLNTYLGFATRWGGAHTIAAHTIENGIRILIPSSLAGGAAAGTKIGNWFHE